MKRNISPEDFNNFIKNNYNSKLEFAKKLKISYSHLDRLLKQEVKLGNKVFKRLEIIMGDEIESILEAVPMTINGEEILEILVIKEGELICSITSKNIVEKEGYKVACVPKK